MAERRVYPLKDLPRGHPLAGVDWRAIDPRADLANVAPENVDVLLPMALEAKRRRYTARDFGEQLSSLWAKQARRDLAHRERYLVEAELKKSLLALSEIILAVFGERVEFTLSGVLQS